MRTILPVPSNMARWAGGFQERPLRNGQVLFDTAMRQPRVFPLRNGRALFDAMPPDLVECKNIRNLHPSKMAREEKHWESVTHCIIEIYFA